MVKKGLLLVLIAIAFTANALEVPKAPTYNRWVQDYANLLNADEERIILQKLKGYYDSTSNEFVLVTLKSLEGDDPYEFGMRLAEQWGIGRKGKDNGLLMLIAYENNNPNRRKLQILVGDGLEGSITDARTGRVRRDIMGPLLRQNRYGQAVGAGFDAFIQMAEGEFVNTEKEKSPISVYLIIFIIIIIIFVIMAGGGDNDGYTYTGRRRKNSGLWWIGTGGSSNWNGGGSGWSGGGFSGGFGGGGFSGGGSGGGW